MNPIRQENQTTLCSPLHLFTCPIDAVLLREAAEPIENILRA